MRVSYLFKTVTGHLWADGKSAVALLACIALSLALCGLLLMGGHNAYQWALSLKKGAQFMLYLRNTASSATVAQIQKRLARDSRIASFTYISREDALQLFRKSGGEVSLLAGTGGNPLPAAFEVKVGDVGAMKALLGQYRKLAGVEEAQNTSEWLDGLEGLLVHMEIVGLAAGALWVALTMLVVAAAVRLYLHRRSEEMRLMRLIGASPTFIRLPLLMEGATLGGIGGMISLLALLLFFEISKAGVQVFLAQMGQAVALRFLPIPLIVGLVLVGATAGGVGSLLSARGVRMGGAV